MHDPRDTPATIRQRGGSLSAETIVVWSRGWVWFVLINASCGASVTLEAHRAALIKQQRNYETRLSEAERDRRRCEGAADRAEAGAQATVEALDLRVRRLERAAVRDDEGEDQGPAADRGVLSVALARSLGVAQEDVVADGRGAVWSVALSAWFDAGSSQLRPAAAERLARLARFAARRGQVEVVVRLAPPRPPSARQVEAAWRESSERGVALLSALQRQGIAGARLTLAVDGAVAPDRILFGLHRRADRSRMRRGP